MNIRSLILALAVTFALLSIGRTSDLPEGFFTDATAASGSSFRHPRVLAGLGDSNGPVTARVIWPDGRTETWPGLAIDRYATIREGTGR
jgi:ASPIC/UnbV protein